MPAPDPAEIAIQRTDPLQLPLGPPESDQLRRRRQRLDDLARQLGPGGRLAPSTLARRPTRHRRGDEPTGEEPGKQHERGDRKHEHRRQHRARADDERHQRRPERAQEQKLHRLDVGDEAAEQIAAARRAQSPGNERLEALVERDAQTCAGSGRRRRARRGARYSGSRRARRRRAAPARSPRPARESAAPAPTSRSGSPRSTSARSRRRSRRRRAESKAPDAASAVAPPRVSGARSRRRPLEPRPHDRPGAEAGDRGWRSPPFARARARRARNGSGRRCRCRGGRSARRARAAAPRARAPAPARSGAAHRPRAALLPRRPWFPARRAAWRRASRRRRYEAPARGDPRMLRALRS